MKWELKAKELQLLLRGLEDEEEENAREKMVDILAELLDQGPKEIRNGLDHIF